MNLKRMQISPSMIVAMIALFVALGGAAYAGVSLSNNTVRSNHIVNGQVKTPDLANSAVTRAKIKNNAVNSAKVQNGSLEAADLSATALATLKGNAGPAGPEGPAGPGAKWILVSATGVRIAGSAGVTVSSKPFPGEYRIDFGVPTSGKLVLASISERDNVAAPMTIQASPCGVPSGATSDSYPNCASLGVNIASVIIRRGDTNVATDYSFYLALIP